MQMLQSGSLSMVLLSTLGGNSQQNTFSLEGLIPAKSILDAQPLHLYQCRHSRREQSGIDPGHFRHIRKGRRLVQNRQRLDDGSVGTVQMFQLIPDPISPAIFRVRRHRGPGPAAAIMPQFTASNTTDEDPLPQTGTARPPSFETTV
jgi:hypothetical protein